MKGILIGAIVGLVIAVPWTWIVLLGVAMGTAPRFSVLDLMVALPPTLITGALAAVGIQQARRATPIRKGYHAAFVGILLACLGLFAMLLLSYLDLN